MSGPGPMIEPVPVCQAGAAGGGELRRHGAVGTAETSLRGSKANHLDIGQILKLPGYEDVYDTELTWDDDCGDLSYLHGKIVPKSQIRNKSRLRENP